MPKKTRQEKIIAQYRQKIKLLQNNPKLVKPIFQENITVQEDEKKEKPQVIEKETEQDIETKKYFISDFKKSLFVISLIIALEIGLYFATMIK